MKTLINYKRKLMLLLIVVIVIASICFIWLNKMPYDGEAQVSYLKGSFVIDYNNLSAVVGDADYVFVGEVVSEDGTEYRDYVTVETETGGSKVVGDPYTKYTIIVTENIKGNLITEEAFPIMKYGGVSEDGRACYLFEGDELPVVGGTYIFFAYAQEDGSLLISGPVSNVPMENDEGVARMNNDAITYEEVVNAYQNQIDSGRKRAVSTYEEK